MLITKRLIYLLISLNVILVGGLLFYHPLTTPQDAQAQPVCVKVPSSPTCRTVYTNAAGGANATQVNCDVAGGEIVMGGGSWGAGNNNHAAPTSSGIPPDAGGVGTFNAKGWACLNTKESNTTCYAICCHF